MKFSFRTNLLRSVCALALTLMAVPAAATTWDVPAGGSLQAAIDVSKPGDTIIVPAGLVFVGPFWLRYKAGYDSSTDWITIRTSTPDGTFPPPGTRVTPSHAPMMAK